MLKRILATALLCACAENETSVPLDPDLDAAPGIDDAATPARDADDPPDARALAADAAVVAPDASPDAAGLLADAAVPPIPDAAPPDPDAAPDAPDAAPDAAPAPPGDCAYVDLPLLACRPLAGPQAFVVNGVEVRGTTDDVEPEGLVYQLNAVAEQTGVMASLIHFDPLGEGTPTIRLTAAPGASIEVRSPDDPALALDATCPGQCGLCVCDSDACRRRETCVQVVGTQSVDAVDPDGDALEVVVNGASSAPFRAAIARSRGIAWAGWRGPLDDRLRVTTNADGMLVVTALPGSPLDLGGDPAALARLGLGAPRVATCPGDCGPCGEPCGDGRCQGDETIESCATDCRPSPDAAPCLGVTGALPIAGGALTLGFPGDAGADFFRFNDAWVNGEVVIQPGDADGALRALVAEGYLDAVFEVDPAGHAVLSGRAGHRLEVQLSAGVAAALGFPGLGDALLPTEVVACRPCGDFVCGAEETPETCPVDCPAISPDLQCLMQTGPEPVAAGDASWLLGDAWPDPPVVDVADFDATGQLRTVLALQFRWSRIDAQGHLVVLTPQFGFPGEELGLVAPTPEAAAILGFGAGPPPPGVLVPCPAEPFEAQCVHHRAPAPVGGGALDDVATVRLNGVALGPVVVQPGDADGALVAALNALRPQTGVDAVQMPDGRLFLSARGADRIDVEVQGRGAEITGLAAARIVFPQNAGLCGTGADPEPGRRCTASCPSGPVGGGRLDSTTYVQINGQVLTGIDVQPCDADHALRDALERMAPATGVHARRELGCSLALTADPGFGIVLMSVGSAGQVTGLSSAAGRVVDFCPVFGACGVCPE